MRTSHHHASFAGFDRGEASELPSELDPPFLCECGCGQPTPLATKTNTAQGRVKGQPVRFIKGHHMRLPEYQKARTYPSWTNERRERHRATKRAKALGHKYKSLRGNTWYWKVLTPEGYRYEHRIVAGETRGRPLGKSEHVHHVDGDGLNNDPSNLVVVSHAEHMALHRTTEPREPREPRDRATAARLPEGTWARHFPCCSGCGTAEKKHIAKGLCSTCYRRPYGKY